MHPQSGERIIACQVQIAKIRRMRNREHFCTCLSTSTLLISIWFPSPKHMFGHHGFSSLSIIFFLVVSVCLRCSVNLVFQNVLVCSTFRARYLIYFAFFSGICFESFSCERFVFTQNGLPRSSDKNAKFFEDSSQFMHQKGISFISALFWFSLCICRY